MVDAANMEATRVPDPFILKAADAGARSSETNANSGGRNPTELAGSRPENSCFFLFFPRLVREDEALCGALLEWLYILLRG